MPAPFRVLITDRAWPDCSVERQVLASVGAEVVEAPRSDEATLIELARDADAIGTNWAQVTANVIRAASRCRIVARFGIGLDNISVTTATELGIPVTNVPTIASRKSPITRWLCCWRPHETSPFFTPRTKAGEYQLSAARPCGGCRARRWV